ncbi:MAG: glutathione peroxidase [Calditrichaeota bacterium]|nr:glutathione peroxidase [Calditrichota bacterium]MCB9369703.1 glutathione peroxidase [Calditrichota bacterium]
MATDLQNIPFLTNSGDTTSLAAYKGDVVMIVNTASLCGNTPQYAGLEKLYATYKDRGFTILAFPANDFGKQEPGTNDEIKEFCTSTYGVTFPLMSKITVLGDSKHPLYKYLVEHSDPPAEIEWNFTKFLVDRDGKMAARFFNKTQPEDSTVTSKIEELLGAKPSE